MPPNGASGSEQLSAVQLDELRHRLRNHLQNMTSLISLQVRRAQHPETIQALEDLRARFATIASIYVDLDGAGDKLIAVDEFLEKLVHGVATLYDPNAEHRMSVAIAPLALSGQSAVLVGQIMVELLINVYRHGLADRDVGTFRIELAAREGEAILVVADDGPGVRDAAPDRTRFGFSIISGLASALGGMFEHESCGGFVARVRFPLDAANEAR